MPEVAIASAPSSVVPTAHPMPRAIAAAPRAYAFERSLGIPPAEACRRAGGKVENGQATKWEQNKRVQAWIAWYRSQGTTEEMLAAKRARIEDRLNLALYGDVFEFAEMVHRIIRVRVDKDTTEEREVHMPMIDWDKVAASPYRAIVSRFKFDKDTGELTDFERDDALAAAAQLRDMYGFRAPRQTELTGKGGAPIEVANYSDADRVKALANLLGKVKQAAQPVPGT